MEYRTLPKRFWTRKEFEGSGEEQPHTYSNLKSVDFKKYYTKAINPFLKEQGFKCNGFKAVRETTHTTEIVSFDSGKYGGYGQVTVAVHPKKLPTKDDFEVKGNLLIYQFLFNTQLTLPNGNEDIDLGTNEASANESCTYLLDALRRQGIAFFEKFADFPAPFLSITVANFDSEIERLAAEYPMKTNYGKKIPAWALWLARFHFLLGDKKNADQLAEYAIILDEKYTHIHGNDRVDMRLALLAKNIINGVDLHWSRENGSDFDEWYERWKAEKRTEESKD